jgi:ubiquinone/menaquinone biosynthesis C-methylase UbiE
MDDLKERYARRDHLAELYSPMQPDVRQTLQERQRALIKLFLRMGWSDISSVTLVEVGCGSGGNLLELLHMGFAPQNLRGAELLPDRFLQARQRLPAALRLYQGDATQLALPANSIDVVYASTVFSSVLQDSLRQRLADAMWRWTKPGGFVLCYDFTVNNPRNLDVRAVTKSQLQQLFPEGRYRSQRLTLAPPLARFLCRIHPTMYPLFNVFPFLRTHRLSWIQKPLP